MTKKTALLLAAFLFLSASLAAYTARSDIQALSARFMSDESDWFAKDSLPLPEIHQIFDMGIVDANQDGHLDIYTSNHNYQQVLWLADGRGGYADKLSEWGLDQIKSYPGWEQSWKAPAMNKPGIYIYWLGDTIHISAKDSRAGSRIGMHIYSKVEIVGNEGFQVEKNQSGALNKVVTETSMEFAAPENGELVLYVPTRGGPVSFSFDDSLPLTSLFIGSRGITPGSRKPILSLLDRHSLAWTDLNNDGRLDLFMNRGGMGGSLRNFPDHVRSAVKDELLVTGQENIHFIDGTRESGIEKRDCSGRHAKWVDFNQDGRIDLFINCLDRGNVAGIYGKQLYEQMADGKLVNNASRHGLDIPEYALVDFAWLDVDNDGDTDLVSHEHTGYYIYRKQDGRHLREFVYRAKFERSDIPKLKGDTFDYWQFDGKMSFGDFDNDGDLDIFTSSKKGNVLLVNNAGRYAFVEPGSVGLPTSSISAAWVDFDNNGKLDLHAVPEGLFRQKTAGKFESTNILVLRPKKYQAAIINWYDKNNDGSMDALIALEDNPSLWRWWEKPFKQRNNKGKDDRFTWPVLNYRNIGKPGRWLQLNLAGSPGNLQAIGARVTVTMPDGMQTQTVGASEGAYLSQGHYRLYFGLGNQTTIPSIKIHWPNGQVSEQLNVKAGQLLTIRQGS